MSARFTHNGAGTGHRAPRAVPRLSAVGAVVLSAVGAVVAHVVTVR